MGCPLSTVCVLSLALAETASTSTTTTVRAPEPEPPKPPAPIVELISYAEGPELYSFWGHAAIRVIDPVNRRDVVYNFGSVDFSGNFLLRMLRGRVDAFVSVGPTRRSFSAYRAEDRTIIRRRLALSDEGARGIAERLEAYVRGERHEYRYHHFRDNCSTRVALEIDRAFDGRLSASAKKRRDKTYRERSLHMVRPYTVLYAFLDIVMTSAIDRPIDRWEASFLPHVFDDVLDETKIDGKPVVAEKVAVYTSPNDAKKADPGWPWIKIYLLLVLPLVALTYWRPRAGTLIVGPLFGLLGVSICLLWFGTTYDFVNRNVNLAVFPPTHLVLFAAATSFARFKRHIRTVRLYLAFHLAVLFGLAVLDATHFLAQEIGPALGLALPVTLILVVKTRHI